MSARRRQALGLRWKIVLALGAMVFAIGAAAAVAALAAAHRERVDALTLRAELVGEAMAAALSSPIWEYDQDAASAVLEGALRDPEFLGALVLDDAGERFSELRHEGAGAPPADSERITVTHAVMALSPSGEPRPIGQIQLALSKHLVRAALRRQAASALLVLALLLAVLSAGILVSIRKFTRPLEEMTAMMDRRALGDFTGEVDARHLRRGDEIGAIARSLELDQQQRRDEHRLLEITREVSSAQELGVFLSRVAEAATALLSAERCLIYLHDAKRGVLWTQVGEGVDARRVEQRPDEGPVGESFTKGVVVNRGREMLCVPVVDKDGRKLGVIQVADDLDEGFTSRDELRLRSLAAQAAAAIENAQLFADVLNVKNYNESILRSLSDGVISLDSSRRVAKANAAAVRILGAPEDALVGRAVDEVLKSPLVLEMLDRVRATGRADVAEDTDLALPGGERAVNLSVVPLADIADEPIGSLLVVEDVSSEKRLRGTMTRYLPKKVVDQLLDTNRGVLGGTAQTVTALFSDIRGFTTISEEIGPRETVGMLNEYFTEMLEVIDQHNGVLDKFIGDAVMAIFGVPFVSHDDASNALGAANDMLRALETLNERRAGRGQPAIAIGVGLNTGEAVAGNIGSPKRMAYTVIGDSVNLASRLEGATKVYGAAILVSESTYAHAKELADFREVDVIRVKGKLKPVAVYESFAWRREARSPEFRAALEKQAAGIAAFRRREWAKSRALFEGSEAFAGDKLPRVYLDRIGHYQASPPPESWDGVAVMTSK